MQKNNQTTHLKREVLIRIVKAFNSDNFTEQIRLIPLKMRPKGTDVSYRCCIHKERAILRDRVIAGLGFSIEDSKEEIPLSDYAEKSRKRTQLKTEPFLTILDEACKGCTPRQIYVTDLCQGCVARPCKNSCKFGAIEIINGKSVIDPSKCKNCKMCIMACPYNAIVKIKVPCEDACPVDAISKDETGTAKINFEKCITCGKCITYCPFGAVHEKSQLIDILEQLKNNKKVAAMIAPSIVGQFPGNINQLKSALLKLGFYKVYEVAQGADITIKNEVEEFEEKMENDENFMTTSCCAGYNEFVKKHIPELKSFVSKTETPLYYTAEMVKKCYPEIVTVFISPCTAKKIEGFKNSNIDFILNYEELGALFVGKKIDILDCSENSFEKKSSKQARNFGISGGVANALKFKIGKSNKMLPHCINGLNKDTIKELKKITKDKKLENGNFIEVMCCEGGCLGGNSTLNPSKNALKTLNEYLEQSDDID